ncbi:sporozoite surface protein 2-like [Dendrobium catenatum]|uniref:sporozoite surface protein 2-like n=1 Tax=Dendrobium catenatum TaxID=906689 RepID=UPI0009F5966C|nr:sporozoite surface protein 2-like [Dendrobium catenatum]
MAWSGGPWFFFGKPFILQKWTPDFVPVREEFPSIPLWIKIKNFPLSCWTPEGISKIASCVGIRLAVDALTAAKTRLTFARVCVQVCSSSPLPDEIYYTVDDKKFPLTVLYDWKPTHCTFCNSIMHAPNACPKNPNPQQNDSIPNRGRSTSRKPRNFPPKLNIPKAPPQNTMHPQPTPTPPQPSPPLNQPSMAPTTNLIPNLNSPSEDFTSNLPSPTPTQNSPTKPLPDSSPNIPVTNKFDALSYQDTIADSAVSSSNMSEKQDQMPTSSTYTENSGKPPDPHNLGSNSKTKDKQQPYVQSQPASNSKNTRAKSAKKANSSSSKSQ